MSYDKSMKKWVYGYFYKGLSELIDMLEDMDISEEKKEELENGLQNISNNLRED